MALLNQPSPRHSASQKGWILITVLAMLTVLGILGLGTLAPQRLQNQTAMNHRQHWVARNLAINYAEGHSNTMHQWLNGFTLPGIGMGDVRRLSPSTDGTTSPMYVPDSGLWLNAFRPSVVSQNFNWWVNHAAVSGPRWYMDGPLVNFAISEETDSLPRSRRPLGYTSFSKDGSGRFSWGEAYPHTVWSAEYVSPYANPNSLAIDSASALPMLVTEYLGCDVQTLKPVFLVNALTSSATSSDNRVYFRKSFSPTTRRPVTLDFSSTALAGVRNNDGIAGLVSDGGTPNYSFSAIPKDVVQSNGNLYNTHYARMGLYDERIFYIDKTGVDFPEATCFAGSSTPVRALAKCETNCMNYYRVAVMSNTTNCNWVYGEWMPYRPDFINTWNPESYRGANLNIQDIRSAVQVMNTNTPTAGSRVLEFSCVSSL